VAENQAQPFDEHAVLQELEELHHAILASRKEREHAVAKFDTFVRGFRPPAPLPASDAPVTFDTPLIRGPWVTDVPPASAVKEVLPEVQPSVVRTVETVTSTWTPVPDVEQIEPSTLGPPPPAVDPIASLRRRLQEQDYSAPEEPVRTWRSKSRIAILGAAAAVAIVGLLMFVFSGPGPAQQASPSPAASQATPPPAPAASSAAPAVQGPVRALRVELTTLRPVWMRVTVDDGRPIERQVPAGQHLPYEADRRIAVRAGDAGAVRVTVDGRDIGVLGADGQVVSRAFTAAPAATDRVPR